MISGDDIILLFNVFNSNSAVDALHLYQYYIIGAFLAKPMMKRWKYKLNDILCSGKFKVACHVQMSILSSL